MFQSYYNDNYYYDNSYENEANNINCLFTGLMDGNFERNEVRSLKFDPHEEIMWCISTYGHLCGYYEWSSRIIVSVEIPDMNKKANENDFYELIDVLPSDRCDERLLYILNNEEICVYSKMGYLKNKIKLPQFQNLRCMSHGLFNSNQLILGDDTGILQLDIERETIINNLKISEANIATTALLRYSRGLLASYSDGVIATVDFRTPMSLQDRFKPHSDGLNDFTINPQGYTVVSCGTTLSHGLSLPDPHLQVYDLRYRKAQCPIKTEMRPSFVRFLPVFNDCLLIVSASSGFFQIANFGQNFLTSPTQQIQISDQFDAIRSLDISSNASVIGFGNTSGLISTVTRVQDESHPQINIDSQMTPLPRLQPYMEMDPVKFDDAQFSVTNCEFVADPNKLVAASDHNPIISSNNTITPSLSSDWPEDLISGKYKKFKPIDFNLFREYPSKFKTELIGIKPLDWGCVWNPY